MPQSWSAAEARSMEKPNGRRDHWKAKDALRAAIKKGKKSILQRWQRTRFTANHKLNTSGQKAIVSKIDISKIDISYTATYQQRLRYENTIALISNDPYQAGPLKNRTDDMSTTRALTSLQIQEGRQHPFIPKHERSRRRPIDEQWRELTWNGEAKIGGQHGQHGNSPRHPHPQPTWSWQEQDRTGGHTGWRNYESSDWQAQLWKSEKHHVDDLQVLILTGDLQRFEFFQFRQASGNRLRDSGIPSDFAYRH